jgi:hypothetical protein
MILLYRQSMENRTKWWQTVSCGDVGYKQRNGGTAINEAGIIAHIAMNID